MIHGVPRKDKMRSATVRKHLLGTVLVLSAVACVEFGQSKELSLRLAGRTVAGNWITKVGSLRSVSFEDLINKTTITLPAAVFVLILKDGSSIRSSEMRLAGPVCREILI